MKASICLCMIVKNEAHIIKETLDGVMSYVQLKYWVICDTGSTDGTQELIKNYFKERKIPGELLEHEWEGFGVNRTKAFDAADGKANYMWVIDADDVPKGNFVIPSKLYHDQYNLNYRSGTMSYIRPQLFKSGLKWQYLGVLHEYAVSRTKDKPKCGKIEGDYHIESRRLGDRSLNPLKYYLDGKKIVEAYYIELENLKKIDGKEKLENLKKIHNENKENLEKQKRIFAENKTKKNGDLLKKHENITLKSGEVLRKHETYMKSNNREKELKRVKHLLSRYEFYAGQSYRDFKDTEFSMRWYMKRAKNPVGMYDEECYQSRIELALLAEKEDKPESEVLALFDWAYAMFPGGAEPFHKAAVYLNKKENFEKAYEYAKKANNMAFPTHANMFVARDIYDYRASKELSYAAMKLGKHIESYRVIEDKLVHEKVPQQEIRFFETIRNMNFSGEGIVKELKKYPGNVAKRLTQKRKTKDVTFIMQYNGWERSTACLNSFLNCCLDIGLVKKFIVYSFEDDPMFRRLYPFVEFIVVDDPHVDILTYSNTTYNIYVDGKYMFIYQTSYIQQNIDKFLTTNGLKQIHFNMMSGEKVGKFNTSHVTMDYPSIYRKDIQADSFALCRRWRSCVELK